MKQDEEKFLEDNFDFNDIKPKKKSSKKPSKKQSKKPSKKNDNEQFTDRIKEKIEDLKDFLKESATNKSFVLIVIIILLIIFILFMLLKKTPDKNDDAEVLEIEDVLEIENNSTHTEDSDLNDTSLNVSKQIDIKEQKNKNQFENIRLKYNGNDDIVAYILVFDTLINSPVAKTYDNIFYQDHDLFKNENIDGALYIDTQSTIEDFSKHSIIYGRSDIPGEQFFDLALYENEKFYNENRFISLDTIYNNTVWEIFSFHTVDDEYSYLKTNFESDSEFETFIVGLKNKSLYDIDVEVSPDDKILTLTSTNTVGKRYVAHAVLYRMN